jgi:SAM-dependent methyltransferase
MKIENRLTYLKHPDSDDPAEFFIENNYLLDKHSNRKYPVIFGMIDFVGINIDDGDGIHDLKSIFFRLNTWFSRHIDGRILMSIFAAGGVGFMRAKKKIKTWLLQVAKDKTLFLDPEDKSLLSFIGHENSLSVEDLASKNILPAPEAYPDVDAAMEKIPIKSNSFQNIVSYFVIEHVKDPRQHFKELARILKPGGYLILGGPGDVYPSHRVPYNFFNIIRFGYYEMIQENNLELIEEYYPAKSWVSILYLSYTTLVRNSLYNKNQITKLLQLLMFIVSLGISPLLNALALLLDWLTPFDKKVYSLYLVLIRKKNDGGP